MSSLRRSYISLRWPQQGLPSQKPKSGRVLHCDRYNPKCGLGNFVCWLRRLHKLCNTHGLDLPVRLIAIPEGALQGFNDEVLDLDHAQFAREGAIDIPGEETEILGQLARECDTFIIAQAKARHPDWKDRFFNVGFILDPRGEVILQHYKVSPLFPVEHSMCPHDIYDWWVQKYGGRCRRSGQWSTPTSGV